MTDDFERRSHRAATSARSWGEDAAANSMDDALARVRAEAQTVPLADTSVRRVPLLLAGAAAAVVAVGGLAMLTLDRGGTDDTVVPVEVPAVETTPQSESSPVTEPEPTTEPSVVDPIPVEPPEQTVPQPTVPEPVDPTPVQPTSQQFTIDLNPPILVRETTRSSPLTFGIGAGPTDLGKEVCTECDGLRPFGPVLLDDGTIAIGDAVNFRVQIVDAETGELIQTLYGAVDEAVSATVPLVGQPVVGPVGDQLFVPMIELNDRTERIAIAPARIDEWTKTDDGWMLTDSFVSETDGVEFWVWDDFVIDGRNFAKVNEPTLDTTPIFDLDPDVPFTPSIGYSETGFSLADEAGNVTTWAVDFIGEAAVLDDGSLLVAGSVRDVSLVPAPLLLRLWPDGEYGVSSWTFDDASEMTWVPTDSGIVSITETPGEFGDGEWLVERWPLPERGSRGLSGFSPDIDGGADGPVLYWRFRGDGPQDSEEALIEGTLTYDGECLFVGDSTFRAPVLWEYGSHWQPEPAAVILPDGRTIPVGSEVSAGGGYHYADSLQRFTSSDEVVELAQRCAGNSVEGEVAIIQSGPF